MVAPRSQGSDLSPARGALNAVRNYDDVRQLKGPAIC
jgi:hypothetical protein